MEFFEKSFWSHQLTKCLVIYSFGLIIIITLFAFKEIHKIRIPSLIGLFAVFCVILIVVGQAYDYIKFYWNEIYKENDPKTHMNIADISSGFDDNYFFFRTFASLFFGYNYHVGLISIVSTLKKNDIPRKVKIMRRSMISYTTIFLLFGTIGYLSAPINTPDLMIFRYKIYSSDWLIDIGRVFIIISYIMKMPIMYHVYQTSVNSLIFDDPEYTK